MIEGLLRHCTDAEIEANYVDTHGASVVGFAFTELLGFRLLPRLKNIGAIRLYRPDDSQATYAAAGLGADPADPLGADRAAVRPDGQVRHRAAAGHRRGRVRSCAASPAAARSTPPTRRSKSSAAPCGRSSPVTTSPAPELRREIHDGLQVVENWNSANTVHLLRQGRRPDRRRPRARRRSPCSPCTCSSRRWCTSTRCCCSRPRGTGVPRPDRCGRTPRPVPAVLDATSTPTAGSGSTWTATSTSPRHQHQRRLWSRCCDAEGC